MELDKETLINKNLRMNIIEDMIKNNLEKNLDVDIICCEKKIILISVKYNNNNTKNIKEECHSEDILKKIENLLFREIRLINVLINMIKN